MNLFDYQTAAAATAQPRAYDLAYLVPMIVGEVGELFGQKAKSHWHGWDADKLQTELVSEFGDVAWGTAILLTLGNVNDVAVPDYAPNYEMDAWQQLLARSHYLHLFYTGAGYQRNKLDWLIQEAEMLWLTLERNCKEITGVPFEIVLKANLVKLGGRVQRGTLLGQGDHR